MRRLEALSSEWLDLYDPTASDMNTVHLNFLVFGDSGKWCAQCLEHDILAEAESIETLGQEIRDVLSIHVDLMIEKGRQPFRCVPPAPDRFFQMYKSLELQGRVKESAPIELCAIANAPTVLASFAYAKTS